MTSESRTYSISDMDSGGFYYLIADSEIMETPDANPIKHPSKRLLVEIVKELESGFTGPEAHQIKVFTTNDLKEEEEEEEDLERTFVNISVVLSGDSQSQEYKEYAKAKTLGPPWDDRRF